MRDSSSAVRTALTYRWTKYDTDEIGSTIWLPALNTPAWIATARTTECYAPTTAISAEARRAASRRLSCVANSIKCIMIAVVLQHPCSFSFLRSCIPLPARSSASLLFNLVTHGLLNLTPSVLLYCAAPALRLETAHLLAPFFPLYLHSTCFTFFNNCHLIRSPMLFLL